MLTYTYSMKTVNISEVGGYLDCRGVIAFVVGLP